MLVEAKISGIHREGCKRKLEGVPATIAELNGNITKAFGLPKDTAMVVKWVDEDGDHVTISSDVELKEAFTGNAATGRCFLVTLPGMDSESIEKILTSTTDGEDWVLVKPEDCEPQTDTPPGPAAALANEDASMAQRGAETTPEHPKHEERAEACQRRDTSVDAKSLKRRSPALQTKMADAETWTKMLLLGEMGFGEDYDMILAALQANNMDVAATAEALSKGEVPAPQQPGVVV